MGLLDIADRLVNGKDAHIESWTASSDRDRLIAMRLEIYEQSEANRGSGSLKKLHVFEDPSLRRIAFLTEGNTELHYMTGKHQREEAERLSRFADRLEKSIEAGVVKDDLESIRKAYVFERALTKMAGAVDRDGPGAPADSYVLFKDLMSPERGVATVKALQKMHPNDLELLEHGVFEALPARLLRPIAAAVRDDPTSGRAPAKEVQAEGPRQAPMTADMGRGGAGR